MDAQIADLEAVRQALGLQQVALVGDSYGGLLVLAYALVYPEHVSRLVLSDSPGASWKGMVHHLPQVFPDIEQEDEAEAKRLGPTTDAATRAGLRNLRAERPPALLRRTRSLPFHPRNLS